MATRDDVYAALNSERAYQDSKGTDVGGTPHLHSLEEFVLYMEDYLHECRHQLSRTWTPDGVVPPALDTMRKITAMGVAAMEQHGAPRREGF